MNVTSVLSVMLIMKACFLKLVAYVAASSTLLSSAALRILWMIIGALLYGLTTAPPTTVQNVDPGHAVIMKYRDITERAEKIARFFTAGEYTRDCKVEYYPIRKLADGDHLIGIQLEECDDERK